MLKLSWAKCCGDVWCRLNHLDLSTVSGDGVYVIWYVDDELDDVYIYVGQGILGGRLEFHRTNDDVQFYKDFGTLYVTWAKVPSQKRDGVEKYLADELLPLEGKQHPDVRPIEVNLPM